MTFENALLGLLQNLGGLNEDVYANGWGRGAGITSGGD